MDGSNGSNGTGGGGHSREYCLRWNNHQPNMVSFLSALLPKESFADVTLVSAEGSRIQAHRIILSACSPYFEGVFESNPCKHPVVILKDVQFVDLRAIVNFIYNGEVNIEVDRINEIIQTATALQVKGLAEVPAEEFKRVSLGGRCSPVENPSPAPVTRTQPPPPLIMSASSVRSWPPTAESSENINDFPVRKKLKKSASANIPFSSGSSSTNGNGDATNSTGSSFESGVGTSVSRSVDEGIGSDISSNDQPQSSLRPGPPPLTAANALLPKSRSLDDGYQRGKNANNIDGEASGYGDHGMDDNSLGQDGGYDDIDGVVDASVKMEGVHHAAGVAYLEGDIIDEEEQVDMTYYEDEVDGYEASEMYHSPKQQESFERPHVPLRKLIPKSKLNRAHNNNNNNSNANRRQTVGVGHSLSLYRQQPLKNLASRNSVGGGNGSFKAEVEQSPRRKTSRNYFEPQFKEKFQEAVKLVTTGKASILKAAKICGIPKSTLYLRLKEMGISSSALIGKRRRGRPLLRQPRIKRLDNDPSPGSGGVGGGRDDGGGYEEQGYSSDTGEPCPNTTRAPSSSSCLEPQQQQHHHHQARSASVEHELYSTTASSTITSAISSSAHSPSPTPQIKPTVPILRVSQCSPTPPASPQHALSPKSDGTGKDHSAAEAEKCSSCVSSTQQIHHHHHQHTLHVHQPSSPSPCPPTSSASVGSSSSSSCTTLLTVPTITESGSPSFTVRVAGSSGGHLVKQVSQPLPLSHHHHYHSSEDEGGHSPSPHHHGNPVIRRQHSQPTHSSIRPYPNYSIVGKGQLFHILKSEQFSRDEESATYLVETPMLQLVPATSSDLGGGDTRSSPSLTLKEVVPLSPVPPSSSASCMGESISITLKEIGHSRSLSHEVERERIPLQHSSTLPASTKEDSSSTSQSVSSLAAPESGSSGDNQLVHRSGHCPALRPGPALGCNFCWNSVDSCGRVLRRKTKYFCPECHINLCIVPCFQEYHEKSDRKKKPRTKLGLPKPSSM